MATLNPKRYVKKTINFHNRIKYAAKNRTSIAKDFSFSIDSPRKQLLNTQRVVVEGWLVPKKPDVRYAIRVRNNQNFYDAVINLKRIDVQKAHPEYPRMQALRSGFRVEFEFQDGELAVEVDTGKGFKKLYSSRIKYADSQLPSAIYNKDLTNNYPEHVNLIENRKQYYFEEPLGGSYKRHDDDPRLIAIYLPQFHPFPENDKAWGKGFTEWANVTSAQPRFIGHQQPILPRDLGYYDLRLESNIEAQINMAKKYGIYGFCFYYYWFSGKKLMDMPINSVLKNKEWDFNFTICWANENWTKRWDGRDNDIIVAQEYLEDDPINFIKDVEPILTDSRYIKEDGKPVLMVYRASELKDPARYAKIWREYFKNKHGQELQLVSFLSFDDQDPREYGFDAALDFAPLSAFFKNDSFKDNKFPYIDVSQKLLDVNFSGVVADYRSIALNEKLSNAYSFPIYPCVTPSWDNDARKKGKGFVYQNSSPDIYAHWLSRVIKEETGKRKSPLIFINAWNEWAEGAVLEPSTHLGSSVLNRTVESLASYSKNKNNLAGFSPYSVARKDNIRLAVVVHLYYVDLWPKIKERLRNISEEFDLFVTLNERDKDFDPGDDIRNLNKIYKYTVPNRGRDVLPFLFVLRKLKAAKYEYILKIHSKKSKHRDDGSNWFDEVLNSLLPNTEIVESAILKLHDSKTGLIGPAGHLVSLKRHMGANSQFIRHMVAEAYSRENADKVISQAEHYPYFGGTMFWARVDVFDKILSLHLIPDDFQSEHGQIDGTLAHAIERLVGIAAKLDKKIIFEVNDDGVYPVVKQEFYEKYKHAP